MCASFVSLVGQPNASSHCEIEIFSIFQSRMYEQRNTETHVEQRPQFDSIESMFQRHDSSLESTLFRHVFSLFALFAEASVARHKVTFEGKISSETITLHLSFILKMQPKENGHQLQHFLFAFRSLSVFAFVRPLFIFASKVINLVCWFWFMLNAFHWLKQVIAGYTHAHPLKHVHRMFRRAQMLQMTKRRRTRWGPDQLWLHFRFQVWPKGVSLPHFRSMCVALNQALPVWPPPSSSSSLSLSAFVLSFSSIDDSFVMVSQSLCDPLSWPSLVRHRSNHFISWPWSRSRSRSRSCSCSWCKMTIEHSFSTLSFDRCSDESILIKRITHLSLF